MLRMTLPAGKTRMTALFATRDGAVGAFYAYVKKLKAASGRRDG